MATYISAQTGPWSSNTTWLTAATDTLLPTAPASIYPQSLGGDKIIIRGGHIVTYDVIGCFGDETSTYGGGTSTGLNTVSANAIVLSGGTLKASRTNSTALTARGTIVIALSGTFDWGTTSDPITANAAIELNCITSSFSALSASKGYSGIYLYGSNNVNVPSNNNIYINGAPKTRHTTLTVAAASGATDLTLDSTSGWLTGDKLYIQAEIISAASTATGLLTATISSFSGPNNTTVTISPALSSARSVGRIVANASNTVTIKSYNALYPSFGIYTYENPQTKLDLNNFTLQDMCWSNGWYFFNANNVYGSNTGTGIGSGQQVNSTTYALRRNVENQTKFYSLTGLVFEYIGIKSNANGVQIIGKSSAGNELNDFLYVSQYNGGTALGFDSQVTVNVNGFVCLQSNVGVYCGAYFPNNVNINNSTFDVIGNQIGATTNGLSIRSTNTKFRSLSTANGSIIIDGIQSLYFSNCSFQYKPTDGLVYPNNNASGNVYFSQCTFNGGSIGRNSASITNRTNDSCDVWLYNPIGTSTALSALAPYYRYNYYYFAQSDNIVRRRGLTSYKIKPEQTTYPFNVYHTIKGIKGVEQHIIGNLRFDSNYGTTYLPSIAFTGAGVNTTFTCNSSANTWQAFDVKFTPSTTDDITVTVTGQSTSTTGYVWLDGIYLDPMIQQTRHYGYNFDFSPSLTVNAYNTLSEPTVSALTTIANLDYLYDAAIYWSVTNPLSASYKDLVNNVGPLLDFGDSNIVVNSSASTAFAYTSATNTITIKSTNLSTLTKFTDIKTTGSFTFINNSVASSSIIIRSSNYNSELLFAGVDSVILYSTLSDAIAYSNPGLSSTNNIIRFKYGATTQGVPMSGTIYARWTLGVNTDVYAQTLIQGTNNTGDIALAAGYSVAATNMITINSGLQKASILVPHNTNVIATTGLAASIQTLIDNQQIINAGLKKSSKLIPHTTNLS